ncbi:MAG: ATPase [Peptoniphilus sp. oral taxon 375]|uniref:ATP synthase subunit C n=1 Tax=Urinicoccus timonensis TaxID=2024205 RepID=UPI00021A2BD4|nr:ATP synthase subunit C [Urinicoccus timonensis]EGS30394.1 ATP synthase subunit C [Peptoniphilus sp. oral taxon 375 str. F0436]MBS4872413.1 ATPase [Peptoniphilus sp. oral taxon 375]
MGKIILFLSLTVVALFAGAGFLAYNRTEKSKKFVRSVIKLNLFIFVPVFIFGLVTLVPEITQAASESASASGQGLGYLAAGLSTGLAALGAGVAVSNVGSAAIGAVSEDPDILGKSMIYLGLAEGIAIYGLIISIMILGSL